MRASLLKAYLGLFRSVLLAALLICWALLVAPQSAHAYIGPGAGFAFLGSAFVFVLTIGMALLTLSLWPLQWVFRKLKGFGIPRNARARRVVIVGLDGLEPKLLDQYMAEGKMPNMKALSDEGGYKRLGTTLPALSPVAWSTFQTGVNPGAHNIFDFLTRDKRYCLPQLASTETVETFKGFRFARLRLGAKRAVVRLTRKSQPFWKVLGQRGVYSNIIRVPISYPPEPFNGNILSAMCTPDLRGTQGSFTYFTSDSSKLGARATGGDIRALKVLDLDSDQYEGAIAGPPDSGQPGGFAECKFRIRLEKNDRRALFIVARRQVSLSLNQFSDWVELEFSVNRRVVSGIVRLCLRKIEPHLELYVSPVNVNPEKPALPIAEPIYFSTWLAKKQGLFGTLGLMEDTWGRNELALDDQRFLDQAYSAHEERERMLFETLDKTREGLCVCVFDASDRIQHMFWRYLDPQHPSPREDPRFADAIPHMYQRMDRVVGEVRRRLRSDDVLMIISDHGFSSFRRGINLNTWLLKAGLLVLKDGKTVGSDYFQDVDWAKTKAFAVGLSGIYLNRKGRERWGIVDDAEVNQLKASIIEKLEQLRDPKDQSVAIRKVYDSKAVYRGLYAEEAPDLIVGYSPGYRVSWDSITGATEEVVFSDNLKAWSGDHHVDPELVPGIFLSNRKIVSDKPNIIDLAPTTLNLFGVAAPRYMEGKVVL